MIAEWIPLEKRPTGRRKIIWKEQTENDVKLINIKTEKHS